MIDLCVINYNTRPLLQRLLDNLHKSTSSEDKFWDLYIADNHSSDDTVDWLRLNDDKYKINRIDLNQNIGYSAAANKLASRGCNSVIGILNADVWFNNNDIKKICKIFNQEPNVHILGPKQRDEYGNIRHAGIVGTNIAPVHRGWNQNDPEDLLYRDRVSCVTVSGSAYFIRRSVWNALTKNDKYQEMLDAALIAYVYGE